VYSYRFDLLQLYGEVFADEDYEVSLAVPNVKNILYLEQNTPDLILVDITKEEDPIELFFVHWLQKHPMLPKLFCMDKYLQNTEIQVYLKDQNVVQLSKPFDISVLIEKAELCLQAKLVMS
jgi:DNA-binding NtrC family response regulator